MLHDTRHSATSYSGNPLKGTVTVPGDKSISQRALIVGLLTTGTTRITSILESEDVHNTLTATTQLGAIVTKEKNGDYVVQGRGIGLLAKPQDPLFFGNSGTGVRLMMGVVASHPFETVLTGDASLSSRPMKRVSDPLLLTGANFKPLKETTETDVYLPLRVIGTQDPLPIKHTLEVASAQVKSALIFAALNAPGISQIIEPCATRDHTERMLRSCQADIQEEFYTDGSKCICIKGQQELQPTHIIVPGDPSSAAFLICAALIIPQSEISVENILMNPSRIGFIKALKMMGAQLTVYNERIQAGEEIADIHVKSSLLKGIHLNANIAPTIIDEYPILSIVASYAKGESYFEGLQELRVKESDRLSGIVNGLKLCGVECYIETDNLRIIGTNNRVEGITNGEKIQTHLDHRIAMSFLVMGLAAKNPISIDDHTVICSSFPSFIEVMTKLGARIESRES